jgi:hypothetical protein
MRFCLLLLSSVLFFSGIHTSEAAAGTLQVGNYTSAENAGNSQFTTTIRTYKAPTITCAQGDISTVSPYFRNCSADGFKLIQSANGVRLSPVTFPANLYCSTFDVTPKDADSAFLSAQGGALTVTVSFTSSQFTILATAQTFSPMNCTIVGIASNSAIMHSTAFAGLIALLFTVILF